jgi:hypothetical protein
MDDGVDSLQRTLLLSGELLHLQTRNSRQGSVFVGHRHGTRET